MIFHIVILAELGAWLFIPLGFLKLFTGNLSDVGIGAISVSAGAMLAALRMIAHELEPWRSIKSNTTGSEGTSLEASPSTRLERLALRGMLGTFALMSTLLFLIMNDIELPPPVDVYHVLHAGFTLLVAVPFMLIVSVRPPRPQRCPSLHRCTICPDRCDKCPHSCASQR